MSKTAAKTAAARAADQDATDEAPEREPEAPIAAVWTGPAGLTLPDGTLLVPGETVAQVGADEARESGHWTPKEA